MWGGSRSCIGGTSIGFPDIDHDKLVPTTTGHDYDVRRALAPVTDLGIRDSVSVVTGMTIPWGPDDDLPPGGRRIKWHAKSMAPLLCGVRGDATERPRGATSDQVAADVLGATTPHRLLTYRVQAGYYRGSNEGAGSRGRISYRRNVDGEIVAVDPIVSPRLAYESLFTGFIPPDPEQAAEALIALRRRKSALDLVIDDAQALIPRLGAADRQRVERRAKARHSVADRRRFRWGRRV